MDERQKRALVQAGPKLLKDLKVEDVQDHLLAQEIISQDHLDEIRAERTRKGKAQKLLELLPQRGPRAFSTFVEALRRENPWLAAELDSNISELNDSRSEAAARSLEEVLRAGAVPSLPAFHIPRKAYVNEVQQRLKELKETRFVGVYGMPGIGKSVCVNHALRDPEIVLETFPGGVFWVSVGQADPDVLINKVQALCERLSDDQSTAQLPPTVDIAVEKLRKLLNRPERRPCLLVLDDVWKPEVVGLFDLGAWVLVTTRDAAVLDRVEDRTSLVQIRDGFSLEETLELFSKRLSVPTEHLPSEAADIHSRCAGLPMMIALLCSSISGRRGVRESGNRWRNCLDILKQAQYEKLQKRYSHSNTANVMDAIELSVKSLDEEHAEYFKTLAVFGADVSIPCQVLSTYWEMSPEEVEDLMADLVKKSLVQDMWDSKLGTMFYSMHDLIVDYMAVKYTDDEKKELHKKLLYSYVRSCQGDFGLIPDDEYMLWYIGHHVYASGHHELFETLYFDLRFVGNKLRVTGPSDLLSDYRKYAEFLDKDSSDTRRRDFENFVRTAGHRLPAPPPPAAAGAVESNPNVPVIQLALCQPNSSAVYREAERVAKKESTQLFFRWCNKEAMQWSNVLLTKVFSGAVGDVVFTHGYDDDLALAAYGEGNIKLWNVLTGDEHPSFRGHSDRVKQITVSPDGSRFVSASDDHTLKIWDLAGAVDAAHGRDACDASSGQRTPSPRIRQSSGAFSFSDARRRDDSILTLKGHECAVRCVDWSPCGSYLLSGDVNGTLKVWDQLGGEVHHVARAHEGNVTCCSFSPDSSYFATGSDDGLVKLWQTASAAPLYTFRQHTVQVISLSLSRDNNVIVSVADNEIFRWTWQGDRRPSRDYVALKMRSSPRDHELYLCSRLSHDQRRLVVGTSSNMYETWDLQERRVVATQRGFAGSVTSLVFSRDGERLLAGAGDMVTSCCLATTPKLENSLQPLFSARFASPDPKSLVVAAITSNNGVQILKGLKGEVETTTNPVGEKIIITEINKAGTMVAFGCEDGSVGVYEIGQMRTEPNILGKHMDRVISLQFGPENAVVSGSEDNTMKVWWPDRTNVTCGGNDGAVTQVGLYQSEQGLIAVSCSRDGTLKVYLAATGKLLTAHRAHSGSTVTCYRIVHETPETRAENGTENGARDRSPCPPDLVVVTAAVDGVVKMCRLCTGELLKTFNLNHGPVRTFQLSEDNHLLVTGHDNGIIVVTRTDHKCPPLCLTLHQGMVNDLVISPDGKDVISVGDSLAWWRLTHQDCGTPRGGRSNHAPDSPRLRPPERRFFEYPSAGGGGGGGGGPKRRQSVAPELTAELRQVFAFHGTLARRLVVSADWTTLVTIDDAGVLYILQVM